MNCPFCGFDEDRVIDSRPAEEGAAIRRRRECLRCQERFTTYEKVESMPFMVIKKDGSRQPYSREKLINGILKSCEKRPVSTAQIDVLVNEIERQIANALRREIPTREIGERVLALLRDVDEVAYVRFASVYREFEDVHSFMRELNQFLEPECNQ